MSNRIMFDDDIPKDVDWMMTTASEVELQWVYQNYLGKNYKEIQKKYVHGFYIDYVDDLRWMPPIPFCYYIQGVIDFIVNRKFCEVDGFSLVSPFLDLIEEKLKDDAEFIAPIMEGLIPIIGSIAKNQLSYDADIDIFGDFLEQEKRIKNLWKAYKDR